MEYTIDTFDWKYYIDQYSDLRDAGILTKEKAWNHWTKFGKNENRLNRKIINKLKVYSGENHPHEAQNPEVIN